MKPVRKGIIEIDLVVLEVNMKQEQIKRMEDAIAADYRNMVGMVIVKDSETVAMQLW